ncbi:hypothetical protein AB7M22_002940 [Pseudomonas sp. ADAK2 TE3594]
MDLFAGGGGGASTGIARAYREPDVAVNHNPIALAVNRVNHPETTHSVADVFEVNPVHATGVAAGGHPLAMHKLFIFDAQTFWPFFGALLLTVNLRNAPQTVGIRLCHPASLF